MATWTPDEAAMDAIAELMNIGVGRAAASLSELIGQRIELSVPNIRICQTEACRAAVFGRDQQPETVISQMFDGSIRGRMSICFPEASSVALAQILSGGVHGDASELDAELSDVLLEVGNIVLNGVIGSFSNAMSVALKYSIPEVQTVARRGERILRDALTDDDILIGDVLFSVAQEDIRGSIVVVFSIGSIRTMLDIVLTPAIV
jgi:chemotaxis protein CheC